MTGLDARRATEFLKRAKHQGYLAKKDARTATRSVMLSLDPNRRNIARRVKAGIELPPMPPRTLGSVWAVSMVKDEEDVISAAVRHLFAQGIDAMLIADNGSTDSTPELLKVLQRQYPIFIATDREQAYFQAQKMDYLASWAQSAGARWIVPFDADEFWFGIRGNLRETLMSSESPIASALVFNMFPYSTATSEAVEWKLDTTPSHLRKVAFRTHPLAKLVLGNHAVVRPGTTDLCLRVAHQPYRSFEQFSSKVRGIAPAFEATGSLGHGSERAFNKVAHSLPAADWRYVASLSDDELRREWWAVLNGGGPTRVAWFRKGDVVTCDPRTWKSWDPQGVIPT